MVSVLSLLCLKTSSAGDKQIYIYIYIYTSNSIHVCRLALWTSARPIFGPRDRIRLHALGLLNSNVPSATTGATPHCFGGGDRDIAKWYWIDTVAQ